MTGAMYVNLGANLLLDPIILASTLHTLIVAPIVLVSVRRKVKTYMYHTLLIVVIIVPILLVLLLAHAAYSCGLSISDSEIVLRHMGCNLALIGIPCEYTFNVRDIEEIIVTSWYKLPCKIEKKIYGLEAFVMKSGYF